MKHSVAPCYTEQSLNSCLVDWSWPIDDFVWSMVWWIGYQCLKLGFTHKLGFLPTFEILKTLVTLAGIPACSLVRGAVLPLQGMRTLPLPLFHTLPTLIFIEGKFTQHKIKLLQWTIHCHLVYLQYFATIISCLVLNSSLSLQMNPFSCFHCSLTPPPVPAPWCHFI